MAELPTLKKGSKGDAVKGLQNALNARAHDSVAVDGTFGDATEHAVKQFQSNAALQADGIVGPNTWRELNVYMVQRGDTLSAIAEHQLGDADRWSEIFELNRDLIRDPDEISPDQVLALPAAS
jgi:nucleoid-associated protein YgaU